MNASNSFSMVAASQVTFCWWLPLATFSALSSLSSILTLRNLFSMNSWFSQLYHSFLFLQNMKPWNVTCPFLSFTLHVTLAKVALHCFPESHSHHSDQVSNHRETRTTNAATSQSSGSPFASMLCCMQCSVLELLLPLCCGPFLYSSFSTFSFQDTVTSLTWHLAPDFIFPIFVTLIWFKIASQLWIS